MGQQKTGPKKKANSSHRSIEDTLPEGVDGLGGPSLSHVHLSENSFIASVSPDNNISYSYKPYTYVETYPVPKEGNSPFTGTEIVLFFLSGCLLSVLFILAVVLLTVRVTN
jgi:hypothetical protein